MDNRSHEASAQDRPADRQAAMIDLLKHLLDANWGIRYGEQEIQLLPSELPGRLPVEVPVPEGSRIVGSVLKPDGATIVFESALDREQIIKFYEERLLRQGWTKPEPMSPWGGGGFTSTDLPWDPGEYFCFGERGPSLHVSSSTRAARQTAGPSSVYASLNTDPEQSPCSPRHSRLMGTMPTAMEVLPVLRPPAGAVQRGGGSSSGGDSASSEGWLKTDLDLAATHAHYEGQLAEVGWSRTEAGQGGPVACSTWTFTHEGKEWYGLLLVIRQPRATGEYQLRLYVEGEGIRRQYGFSISGF